MVDQINATELQSKPKVVVYTSLFGNYDSVTEPLFIDENVEYILFTDDKNIKSTKWRVEIIEKMIENPRRMARLPKLLAHNYLPAHDISIYLDANMKLKTKNVYQLIEECLEGNDIAFYNHPRRHCTYRELKHCVRVQKISSEIANQVVNKYLQDGFPTDFGLFESGFIIRRSIEKIKKFNELWWNEYVSGSERDQCCLMYCLWKLGITANSIKVGEQIRINPYLAVYKHG